MSRPVTPLANWGWFEKRVARDGSIAYRTIRVLPLPLYSEPAGSLLPMAWVRR